MWVNIAADLKNSTFLLNTLVDKLEPSRRWRHPDTHRLIHCYVETRKALRSHFENQKLQYQDLNTAFDKDFCLLLEPTCETAKKTEETAKALESFPQDIAAAFPSTASPAAAPEARPQRVL